MKILVIGYEANQSNFLAWGDNCEQDTLVAYVQLNRKNHIVVTEDIILLRIENGDPYEIANGQVSFTAFDELPELKVKVAPSQYVFRVNGTNAPMSITWALRKDGQSFSYTGEMPVQIQRPNGKIMTVLLDFVDGVCTESFIPDEGGDWKLAVKGPHQGHKVGSCHKLVVVYKLR